MGTINLPETQPPVAAPREGHPLPLHVLLDTRSFFLLFCLWFVCQSLAGFWGDCLGGDEAQYWDWSRRLSFAYFSKPPMIAYVNFLSTTVFGHSAGAVRLGTMLLTAGAILACRGLARVMTGRVDAANVTGYAALTTLGPFATVSTTDRPLILFWCLTMYGFYRAQRGEQKWWAATGLTLGCALISKYTAALLLAGLALYVLVYRRDLLKQPRVYAALALALCCCLGVVYWNIQNDWTSVRHTAMESSNPAKESNLAQLGVVAALAALPKRAATTLGAQFFVTLPPLGLLFLCMTVLLIRRARTAACGFLICCSAPLFVFYFAAACWSSVQINWFLPAYIALACSTGIIWGLFGFGRPVRSVAKVTLLVAFGLAIALPVYAVVAPPNARSCEGPELGKALTPHMRGPDGSERFIFSTGRRYRFVAWAAHYAPGMPRTYSLQQDRPRNQYDLWGGWEALRGRDGLFLIAGEQPEAEEAAQAMVRQGLFKKAEYLETVSLFSEGNVSWRCSIILMRHYTGNCGDGMGRTNEG